VEGRSSVRDWLRQHPIATAPALLAIGKAAESMTLGALDALPEGVADGLVISKAGHLDPQRLARHGLIGLTAGHPLPDVHSLEAGERLLAFLARQPAGRELLCLISGGASSLVEVLRPGLSLEQLQRTNAWLLASGLPIAAMNRVRRALSRIKGGGLLGYLGPRRVTALLISDVEGDDPAVIGSGLLFPSPATELSDLPLPPWLRPWVQAPEPPAAGPPVAAHIVARLADAMEAAAAEGRRLGYPVRLRRAFQNGEAETVGRRLAREILEAPPGLLLWGGETRVRLPAEPGRGGRNQQLALAAATVLQGAAGVWLLAAGTDGSDGPGEDAGALVDGGTLARGQAEGLDAVESLRRADAGSFLAAAGDLLHTGPTGANVMDLLIGLRA